MDAQEFHHVLETQLDIINQILGVKAGEYAMDGDRLHNFKKSAALKGETPRQALMGMMAKHTVSVYDMGMSDKAYTAAQWDEKITDHLNYLILLKAITVEEEQIASGQSQFSYTTVTNVPGPIANQTATNSGIK